VKMKFLGALFLAATAQAHYTFPQLVAGGAATGAWQYVRKTTNYQSNGPVTDVRYSLSCFVFQPPLENVYSHHAGHIQPNPLL
jgi:hypothetical protein